MPNIRVVIFDMDGLLLDSEKIALTTFIESCRDCHFEPDLEIYYRCIGTTSSQTRKILTEGYGRDFPFEDISALWSHKFQVATLAKTIPLKEGVLSLLQYLNQRGLKKAVVTSTRHEIAVRELSANHILSYFEFVIGGDQVARGKPAPDIYLTACQRFSEDPSGCLALEDSDNGVLAAHNAGLAVIQVQDILEPAPEIRALGHTLVQSLTEVKSLFKQLEEPP